MKLGVPMKRLLCTTCQAEPEGRERGLQADYLAAEIPLPREGNRPPRRVPIKVQRLKIEEIEGGRVRAHVRAIVPCIGGDHLHELDVSDLYRAPKLLIEGSRRCPQGHQMTFERCDTWEYIDNDELGGVIEVSGTLHCPECAISSAGMLRAQVPDMAEAAEAGTVNVAVAAAALLEER